MSIRDRFTLIYAFIFLGAFLLFTVVVYLFPRQTLLADIDRSLEQKASQILEEAQVYSQRDIHSLHIPTEEENVFERANTFIMAVDEQGTVRTRSDNLEGFDGPLNPTAIASGREGYRTMEYDGQVVRVLTVPLRIEQGIDRELVGYLQVARAIEDFDTFNRLLFVTILIGLGAFTASMFVITLISPRLFRPLEKIATLARQISRADDLSRRLPDTGRDDEIGDLTMVLNQTLARLESLFRTQQRFLADVSHELRTPLTTIRGNVDLMRRMGGADQESLDDIQAELDRMTRLVNDLLLLARADAGGLPIERQPVELDTVLLDVYRQLSLLKKPVDIVLEEVDQVQVSGDADRLKQLILNLADNAVKYTPPGGAVRLSLSKAAGEAHLQISDTGIGISEEDLPYIFERFYRVDKARTRAHGGSGLGLSIAKWIVDVHGGRIHAESDAGEGTTFHVILPLLEQTSQARGPGGRPSRTRPSFATDGG